MKKKIEIEIEDVDAYSLERLAKRHGKTSGEFLSWLAGEVVKDSDDPGYLFVALRRLDPECFTVPLALSNALDLSAKYFNKEPIEYFKDTLSDACACGLGGISEFSMKDGACPKEFLLNVDRWDSEDAGESLEALETEKN